MGEPLISIVMPTYNQAKFIKEAIESIILQTHTNWQLIIVNDNSPDNTQEILDQYLYEPRILILKNKVNLHTGGALNCGFALSKGDYETWMASDNIIYPKALERMAESLDKNPQWGHVHTDRHVAWMAPDGVTVKKTLANSSYMSMTDNLGNLLKDYCLGSVWMWRRKWRERIGDFSLALNEDYDFVLRLEEAGCKFGYIPEILGWYRYHSQMLTVTTGNLGYEKVKERARIRRGI